MDEGSADQGIVRLQSQHSVTSTLSRLEALLKEYGIIVFARIDFSGDAARAGLQMLPEQLLVFGNPKAGTPLMVAAPTAGLDLPIKVLAWRDAAGATWLAYNDPGYVVRRHGLAPSLAENLSAAKSLIERAAGSP